MPNSFHEDKKRKILQTYPTQKMTHLQEHYLDDFPMDKPYILCLCIISFKSLVKARLFGSSFRQASPTSNMFFQLTFLYWLRSFDNFGIAPWDFFKLMNCISSRFGTFSSLASTKYGIVWRFTRQNHIIPKICKLRWNSFSGYYIQETIIKYY